MNPRKSSRGSRGSRESRGPQRERSPWRSGDFPGAGALRARYQLPAGVKIDYKNVNLLQRYVTDRGKIVSRRMSNLSAKRQRELAVAIKRARFLGLLPVGVRKK